LSLPDVRKLVIGCGYLGQRVARAWSAAGHEVHVVTRSVDRAREFSALGWVPHVADVCVPGTLSRLPTVETVLFCVGYDSQSVNSRSEVMVDGLAHVLAVCRDRCRRFLYTSSTSVYGQCEGEWVDERSVCAPTQPGGVCCLQAERLIEATFSAPHGAGAGAQILRLAGLYGPGRLLARGAALQRGEPLPGRGDAWLNLIHVDDAVACLLACEERGKAGETWLVCDDQPVRRIDYYSALAELIGAPPPQFDETVPASRGGGQLNKRCSNRKMRQELGVLLRYPSFREGLPQAVGH
jgi:nucleoside-diphosphate-sugar epimerase